MTGLYRAPRTVAGRFDVLFLPKADPVPVNCSMCNGSTNVRVVVHRTGDAFSYAFCPGCVAELRSALESIGGVR